MTEVIQLDDLWFDYALWNTPIEVLAGEAREDYGVKGMKWGIRKDRGGSSSSRNPEVYSDGQRVRVKAQSGSKATLTVGERAIANYNYKKAKLVTRDGQMSAYPKSNSMAAKREAQNLNTRMFAASASDAELRNAINRIRLEREYRSLKLLDSPVKAATTRLTKRLLSTAEDILFESAKTVVKPYVAGAFENSLTEYAKSKGKTLHKFETKKNGSNSNNSGEDKKQSTLGDEKAKTAAQKAKSASLDKEKEKELKRKKNLLDLD